jgi:hypothetical protein
LKHVTHRAPVVELCASRAADKDLSTVGLENARDNIKQGALAGARGAQQSNDGMLFDYKANVLEHFQRRVCVAEAFANAAQADH